MAEHMHAYSHMKHLYEYHMYVYKSMFGYTGQLRCQVLYRSSYSGCTYMLIKLPLMEEFGMSHARVIKICYTKPFVLTLYGILH